MVGFQKRPSSKGAPALAIKALAIGLAIMLVAGASAFACADKNMALMEAIFNGNLEEVKNLLNKGSDVNAKMDGGVTPLMVASVHGNLEIVNLLLDKGADINAKTDKGNSALDFAGYRSSREMVNLLKARGASE
jgi:ankyrin repeat protein